MSYKNHLILHGLKFFNVLGFKSSVENKILPNWFK